MLSQQLFIIFFCRSLDSFIDLGDNVIKFNFSLFFIRFESKILILSIAWHHNEFDEHILIRFQLEVAGLFEVLS